MKIGLPIFEPIGSNKEKEIYKFIENGIPMVFRIPQKMNEIIVLIHGCREGGYGVNDYIISNEQLYRFIKAKVKNKLEGITRINVLCCYGYYQTAETIDEMEIIPLLPSKHKMNIFYGGRTIDDEIILEVSFKETIEEMERLIALKEACL